TLAVTWGIVLLAGPPFEGEITRWTAVTLGALLLTLIGALVDIRGVSLTIRLVLQGAAVAAVIATLPADLQFVPMLPWWLERAALLVGGVWFINLVNFMDGIDWMTVAEVVPVTGGIVALGLMGVVPAFAALLAVALLGATLGFAPFNKPVAKLFLGDSGSLPIGLLLGALLLQVAVRGHLAAALLLPLYYLADATVTLARRALAGERVWEAHRTHFYHRARDHGFTVFDVVSRVFAVNLILVALALASLSTPGTISFAWLAVGAVIVGWLLSSFAWAKR